MNKHINTTVIRSIPTFLVITLCLYAAIASGLESPELIAQVGPEKIRRREINYRLDLEKAYGNEGLVYEVALVAMINDALEYEVASINGISVSSEEMDSFKRFADENTKAPEILAAVKKIFGTDHGSYERIYLRPRIINQKLHFFFSRSPEIQEKERTLIEKAYRLAVSGKSFKEAAESLGQLSYSFTVEDKELSANTELQKFISKNEIPFKDPLIPIVEKLSDREIHNYIIEDDYEYRIVRRLNRKENTYNLEAISVQKRPFDEWFRVQAEKVEITIFDPILKAAVRTKYPTVWWTQQIR